MGKFKDFLYVVMDLRLLIFSLLMIASCFVDLLWRSVRKFKRFCPCMKLL